MDAACTLMTNDWDPVLPTLKRCYEQKGNRVIKGIWLGELFCAEKMANIELAIWIGSITAWIEDLREDLKTFQKLAGLLQHLKDVQRKYILRHRWELEQLCIAPLETIENDIDEALPREIQGITHTIAFPKGKGPYGRDKWTISKLVKKAKEEAEVVLQNWKAVAEDLKLIPHQWFPTDIHEKVATVPLKGRRELLVWLESRAIRDKTFKDLIDSAGKVKPSDVWDKLREAMAKGMNSLHDNLPSAPDKFDSKSVWKLPGGKTRSYKPKWQHPAICHVCFLCGTTGATLEPVEISAVRECLRKLRDQRVPEDGWIKRACDKKLPLPEMNMCLHKSQAYTTKLEAVPGCDTCQRMRRYDELYTIGQKGRGKRSSKDSCGEHVCEQGCMIFQTVILGPVKEENVVEAFLESVSWSLNQGLK